MTTTHLFTALTLTAAILAIAAPVAAQTSFTETFTTTTHRSTATTANWNTATQQLELYPFAPTALGSVDTPSWARDVEIHGDLAYVADGYSGLQIIDISDPAAPSIVGNYDSPGYAYQVRVQGGIAYIADHSAGLRIVDVSDPAAPVFLGLYLTLGNALGLDVDGDIAYVCFGVDGLEVVDVSDPTAPLQADNLTTGFDQARTAVVDGDLLYVASGNSGLTVVDVSDPAAVAIVGTVDTPGYANAVAVSGNRVYLSDDGNGLVVVNAYTPTIPSISATYAVSGSLNGVFVRGDRAYLSADSSGLHVFDVGSLTAPTLVHTYDTVGHAYASAATADKIFVADFGSGLLVLEGAEWLDPFLSRTNYMINAPLEIDVTGDRAYVAYGYQGFGFMFTGDPASSYKAGTTVDTSGYVYQVVARGDHAFVADSWGGLKIYDVHNYSSPTQVGLVSGSASGVDVQGDLACIAGSAGGLRVADVSDVTTPTLLGSVNAGTVLEVNMAGDYCWTTGSSNFRSFDISDPANPTLAGTLSLGATIYSLDASGDLAVAGTTDGAKLIDVSDPAVPVLLATMGSGEVARGATLTGDHVAFAAGDSTLQLWDITNTASPVLTASTDLPGSPTSMNVAGNAAIVGFGDSYTRVYVLFQDRDQGHDNIGRSLTLDTESYPIVAARVTDSARYGAVDLGMRTNSFADWTPIGWNGDWQHFDVASTSLYWRAELGYYPYYPSALSNLTVEWLNEFARITAVDDIPDDQGRQVRLQWRRSGFDFVGHANQIVEYAVYREFGSGSGGAKATTPVPDTASAALIDNAAAMAAAGWDYVTSVPVLVDDDYAVVVPTLADSTVAGTAWSTFKVVALTATPGQFYTSPADSGYSVDNLEPGVPLALTAAYGADAVELRWDEAPEEDFKLFRVYRGTDPAFTPGPGNLVKEVAAPAWDDPVADPWSYHYKVTAVDFAGNESEAAVVSTVTDVPGAVTPLALHPASPNPFNPSTEIRFDLPAAGPVRLVVTDVSGRVVRTLVNEQLDAGSHAVPWRGYDDAGRPVASGVYLYRLVSDGRVLSRQMTLLK